jgi:PAS domain S-box-containing protein
VDGENAIRSSRSDYLEITPNGRDEAGPPRSVNDDEAAQAEPLSPSSIGNVVRIGLVFAIAFHAGYIVENHVFLGSYLANRALPFLLANIAIAAVSIGLSYLPSIARRWRMLAIVDCLLFIGALTWASVIAGQTIPLYTALFLFIAGTCALLPWSVPWQGTVTLACLAAFGINAALVPSADRYFGYRWLGIVTIAAIAYVGNVVWSRWREALRESQRRLRSEFEALQRLVAARQETERLLRQSEAKLRKVFEASPDTITINRMSDGRYLEMNREFLGTGYSRAETLASSSESLGIWADPGQRKEFVRGLRADGIVRSMEANYRLKNGKVRPCLISGVLVELDGEPCVVSVVRDIGRLKRTERELIAARENLRKLFDNSPDPITITTVSDQRITDVNQGFTRALGFTRKEAIGKTTIELGMRVDEERRRKFVEEVCRRGFAEDVEVEYAARTERVAPTSSRAWPLKSPKSNAS